MSEIGREAVRLVLAAAQHCPSSPSKFNFLSFQAMQSSTMSVLDEAIELLMKLKSNATIGGTAGEDGILDDNMCVLCFIPHCDLLMKVHQNSQGRLAVSDRVRQAAEAQVLTQGPIGGPARRATLRNDHSRKESHSCVPPSRPGQASRRNSCQHLHRTNA